MQHSKGYRKVAEQVDRTKLYAPAEAIKLAKKTSPVKFDATVEVAMRLGVDPRKADQMVRGTVNLPHGTGKTARVIVFASGDKAAEAEAAGADVVGSDDLVARIQEGWLDFDAAIATPDQMAKIGRIARILGPRGLMPNPKTGTVTMDVDEGRHRHQGRQDHLPGRQALEPAPDHRQGFVHRDPADRELRRRPRRGAAREAVRGQGQVPQEGRRRHDDGPGHPGRPQRDPQVRRAGRVKHHVRQGRPHTARAPFACCRQASRRDSRACGRHDAVAPFLSCGWMGSGSATTVTSRGCSTVWPSRSARRDRDRARPQRRRQVDAAPAAWPAYSARARPDHRPARPDRLGAGAVPGRPAVHRRRLPTASGRLRGLAPPRPPPERSAAWIDRLGLGPFRGPALADLSKGTAQKVGLAQALTRPPDLLVLDEPWEGLDAAARELVPEIVGEVVAAGGAVVLERPPWRDRAAADDRPVAGRRRRVTVEVRTADGAEHRVRRSRSRCRPRRYPAALALLRAAGHDRSTGTRRPDPARDIGSVGRLLASSPYRGQALLVTGALVRMRLAGYLRSGRVLALHRGRHDRDRHPVRRRARHRPARRTALSAFVLVPVLAWQTKILLDTEPEVAPACSRSWQSAGAGRLAAGAASPRSSRWSTWSCWRSRCRG